MYLLFGLHIYNMTFPLALKGANGMPIILGLKISCFLEDRTVLKSLISYLCH